MFDRLFQNPFVLARQWNGPLAEERHRYFAHCAQQQMSHRTLRSIARYILIAAQALRLAERPGELVTRAEVKAEVDRWLERRSRRSTARQTRLLGVDFTGHVSRWLTFLGRLQLAAPTQRLYADEVARFTDYMLGERGLSPQTVVYRCRAIHQFLAVIDKADLRLDQLTVAQLDELLVGIDFIRIKDSIRISLGFCVPLAIFHPKVVQSTGCLHDRIGNILCRISQDILHDAAALHTRQGVFDADADTPQLPIGAFLSGCQLAPGCLFF